MAAFGDYADFDGLDLAGLVRRREVAPTELVEAAIARIEASNPRLNAVVNKLYERARAAASAPLGDGPFAGVPFVLKDLDAAMAGVPLTASCRALADFVPDRDSEMVARYKRAGLIVVGQTSTPEFGILPVTESALRGPTRNPWNLAHTPGGSSGGSGAAVAARMTPIGHGSDGGGSIRIPASCCGLFGLKPTRGRTPLDPAVSKGWGGLVHEHALSRSVRDSAALLDASQGADAGAPYPAPAPERPFLDEVGADPGRLRIAFSTRNLFGETTHPECKAAVEDAAALCAGLGHAVEEALPDFDRHFLVRAYLAIIAGSTAQAIAEFAGAGGRRPRADDFEPLTRALGLIGANMSAGELTAALEACRLAGRSCGEFFATYDLLLTPTLAHPPVEIGFFDVKPGQAVQIRILRALPLRPLLDKALDELSASAFEVTGNTMLFNLTGQPAMSVPLYWSERGLPIGLQFAARFGDEATLFRLAAQLEQARPWAQRRPPDPG